MREAFKRGVSPKDFWQMTPLELSCLLPSNDETTKPMSRAELAQLMRQYPDRQGRN